MRISEMRVAEIRPDDTYAFSFPSLPERWEGLAERFPGIPLLVVDGERRIVCGHDRLLLLRRQGIEMASVFQDGFSLANGLLLNFNVLDRLFGLNLYEKLLFVGKISPLLAPREVQRRVALGFALEPHLLERLPVLLSKPFRPCLSAGRLGLRTALRLAGLAEADRMALLGIFQACGFSESQQGQIVLELEETAFRAKKSLAAVVAAAGLQALLAGEMPQKRFMETLAALRYPHLSRREREWQAWRRRMEKGGGVALRHAPLFSQEEVQVTLTAKDRAAAEKLLARLKKKR